MSGIHIVETVGVSDSGEDSTLDIDAQLGAAGKKVGEIGSFVKYRGLVAFLIQKWPEPPNAHDGAVRGLAE